jgi:3-dehydroquinate dehydratase
MSIVVITGPRHGAAQDTLADDAMWRLWERAQAAGVDLLWRPCHDFVELTGHLDRSTFDHAELVLIDVDANDVPTGDVAALRDSLSHLAVPYIEIHDDSDAADAGALAPGHPSLVSVVVPGNASAGYAMALSIGLRYLEADARLAA